MLDYTVLVCFLGEFFQRVSQHSWNHSSHRRSVRRWLRASFVIGTVRMQFWYLLWTKVIPLCFLLLCSLCLFTSHFLPGHLLRRYRPIHPRRGVALPAALLQLWLHLSAEGGLETAKALPVSWHPAEEVGYSSKESLCVCLFDFLAADNICAPKWELFDVTEMKCFLKSQQISRHAAAAVRSVSQTLHRMRVCRGAAARQPPSNQ